MLKWLWITPVVVGLDQYTKYVAMTHLKEHVPHKIFSFFNWYLTYNPGAAWSFLRDAGPWKHWFFIGITVVVILLLIVWIARLSSDEKVEAIGFSMIIGGAIGNVIDRLRFEKVVDFIQVHYQDWYFPAFNVADSFITIGVTLLLLNLTRQPPASGNDAAISASTSVLSPATTLPTTHTARMSHGLPTYPAMSPGVRRIPAPMTMPTVMARPSRTRRTRRRRGPSLVDCDT